jgi:peptidyl-prolyl cis-trans isomerase D
MSIIQDIRDKYARVSVIAIALALIGFILTDYFSGRGGGNGRGPNSLGSVNGRTIKADLFAKKVEAQEAQMRTQGYPAETVTQQAMESVWEQEISNMILQDEIDKLGLGIGKKELGDIIYGSGAPDDLKKQLSDENGYDPLRAKQKIDMMLKDNKVPQEQKDNFNAYVEQLKQMRLSMKYSSLLANSVNYPRWFVEKQTADNSLLGKASVVRKAYTEIADSLAKVEDKEIADYIRDHKNDFRQQESRSISYVTFNAAPTAADSNAVRTQLLNLKPEFDTTSVSNAVSFLARNGITNFFNGYVGASQMAMTTKDSIQKIPIGKVYGPYLDANSFVLAKMLDIKTLPDSVKCRHILLGTTDRSGNPIMPDSVAHAKADSVAAAIRNGANFDSLETKYTTDQAAHATKGVMTFSSLTIQGEGFAKEFGDFILFEGKPGDKKVIKTDFGWHYIEIMEFIKPQPAYKVAYLSQEILPSPETDNTALEEATQFASDSKDLKGFDALYEKTQKPKNRVKGVAQNITPGAYQLQGLGVSRQLVRDIYAAKKGEVLKPERINDTYVVAVVTDIFEEGIKTPEAARPEVEPLLRNKKKAAIIKKTIGTVTTLEAAASALGKPVEPIDSVRINATASLGYEPKVSGAIFNPANKGKVVPEALEGASGVFVVRVENVTATAALTGDVNQQRQARYQQKMQLVSGINRPDNPLSILRRIATIKDKRSNRY